MNDIGVIHLKGGGFTIVDAELFPELNQHVWYNNKGRPTSFESGERKMRHTLLHHLVLPKQKGFVVDHKNRFPIDNTSRNLRYATKSQNSQNIPKQKGKYKSKYKGVSAPQQFWRCRIHVGNKVICSYHKTELEAAQEYNRLAKIHHGEFAVLNPI